MAETSVLVQTPEGVSDAVQGIIVVVQVLWLAALIVGLVYALRGFARSRAPRFMAGALIAGVLIIGTIILLTMATVTGTFQ